MTERIYNPVLGRDPWTSLCTFTASSEDASYPASNLGDMDFNRVFRTNGAVSSVTITGVFSRAVPMGMLGLCNYNATQGDVFRLQLYSDAGATAEIYDSDDEDLPGGNAMMPPCYSDEQLTTEDDNWWTATYRTDELENRRRHRMIWLGDYWLTRAWKLTWTKTGPAAILQLGAAIPCRGHQMSKGLSIGSGRGHSPTSVVTPADGGKEYGDLRLKPRVFQGSFNQLLADEADEVLGEMKDRHDIVPENPVLWHPFPQQPRQWLRTSFPARFEALDLQQYINSSRSASPVNLREVI